MSWVVVHGTGDAVGMYMEAPRKTMSNLSGTIFAFLGELSSGHTRFLHCTVRVNLMQWCGATSFSSSPLPCKARAPSALASFSWQFNSEANFYTHASVPGCSAPNALLLPATASQSKGSALAALAWQRGQHVHRHQSSRTLSSQHPSFCFHCIVKQVYAMARFFWRFKKEDKSLSTGRTNLWVRQYLVVFHVYDQNNL